MILHKRRVRFNQATSILSILIALIGVVFTVTTPEIRCLLNLECPLENRSSEDTSIVPDTASDLPSENSSPSSNSAQPNPSPTTSNSSLPSSLRANCIRDSGEDRQEFNEIISVNRQARNPDTRYFLRINQLHSVTCQLISKNPNSIKFIYAIPDRSGLARVKISFYLDGQLTKSLILGRGEIKSVSLNMNDIRSYSVEITALQGRDDFLYFWFDSN